MRLLNYTHFWMLVCLINFILISGLSAWSAPINKTLPDPVKVIVNQNPPELTTPSLLKKLKSEEKNWGIHLGFFNGATVNRHESQSSYTLGFKNSSLLGQDSWETGANISTEKILDINLSRVWTLKTYENIMAPSLKIGLINYIYSPDGLAGLININHFKLRGALAFDDMLMTWYPNIYCEIGVGYGATGSEFDIKFGHSF